MASKQRGGTMVEVLTVTGAISLAAMTALTAFSTNVRTATACMGEKVKTTVTGGKANCAASTGSATPNPPKKK